MFFNRLAACPHLFSVVDTFYFGTVLLLSQLVIFQPGITGAYHHTQLLFINIVLIAFSSACAVLIPIQVTGILGTVSHCLP